MSPEKIKSREQAAKQIKLITLDFDGTLLQRDQIWISLRNRHALRECQKKGILLVPCTGRSAAMFPPQVEQDASFRYWVTADGARIIDRSSQTVLVQETFTPEESAELARLFEGRDIYSETAADGSLYFEKEVLDKIWQYPVPSHHVWLFESGRALAAEGRLSDFLLKEKLGVEKFNLFNVPEDARRGIRAAVEKLPFAVLFELAPGDFQIRCIRTNRILSLQKLLEHLGLTFDNVMSLGDSPDFDGPLIKRAALGIAMGNAEESLKTVADDVTLRSDEDGVAAAIEKWLL